MYVYGKNTVNEIIKNNTKIYEAYIYYQFKEKNLISELQKRNVSIKYVSKSELDKIAKGNHQGIIISIPDYKFLSLGELLDCASEIPFFVILDHINDPHNLGAIIRTCEAAGVEGIIIPKNRSASIDSVVMKTSSGAVSNVPICYVANINYAINEMKRRGIWIVGADMDNSSVYDKHDYKIPIGLVIGSEGFGISRLTKELCDFIIHIPMYGKINSLNASVAAGIIIYKIVEERRK
jgi:23S rRNA (guanosine2251-2'-O)-methyltransferase